MRLQKISLGMALVHLLAYVAGLLLLPEKVAIHFDFSWTVDAVASKWWLLSVSLFPAIIAACSFLDKKSRQRNGRAFGAVILSVTLLMIYLGWLFFFLGASAGTVGERVNVSIGLLVCLPLGALMLVIGNYLPTVRRNHLLGIRSNSTLRSEYVWKKTHALGGITMAACGIFTIVFSVVAAAVGIDWIALAAVFLSIIVFTAIPLIYAFRLYRSRQRAGLEEEAKKEE